MASEKTRPEHSLKPGTRCSQRCAILNGSITGCRSEMRSQGIDVLELDVTNDASVDDAFSTYEKTDGKLDVLINNAGLFAQGLSETYTPEQIREMFDVNVFGIQRVIRAALPEMRKKTIGTDYQYRVDPGPRDDSVHRTLRRVEIRRGGSY